VHGPMKADRRGQKFSEAAGYFSQVQLVRVRMTKMLELAAAVYAPAYPGGELAEGANLMESVPDSDFTFTPGGIPLMDKS